MMTDDGRQRCIPVFVCTLRITRQCGSHRRPHSRTFTSTLHHRRHQQRHPAQQTSGQTVSTRRRLVRRQVRGVEWQYLQLRHDVQQTASR